ncbi:MAG: AraC family transcriptional regulator ligand-binding domain-containing protein [Polyangiales bacterium]
MSGPLQSISGAYVSLIIVDAVTDALRQHGVVGDALERLDRCRRACRSSGRVLVSRREFLSTLASACAHQPGLGLRLGELLNEMSFHVAGPLIATCPTPRQGIATFLQVSRQVLGGASWELHDAGEQVVLGYRHEPELGTAARIEAELAITVMYRSFVHAMGDSSVCAQFAFPAPRHAARYRALFGKRHRFGMRFNGLAIAKPLLDRPRAGIYPELSEALHGFVAERLPRGGESFTEQVRLAIRSERVLAELDLEQLAARFDLSLRSLRRRLEAEQTTLRELVNEERLQRARVMLARRAETIPQIATSLGYFQVSSFQRAFKRWSGCTPGEYRRAAR